MTVFARTTNDTLAGLVKRLEKLASEYRDEKLAVVVAFVSADRKREAVLADVDNYQQKHKFKNVVLTVPKDHKQGVRGLNLNPEADVTVLVYRDKKIVSNRVTGAGQVNATFVDKVAEDVKNATTEKAAE